MKRFHLPDLGEGLQEAEIVRWHVAVGDRVAVDQPMVAMETAKAVVEVPAPFEGVIAALYGNPGDTVATGAPLVDFQGDAADTVRIRDARDGNVRDVGADSAAVRRDGARLCRARRLGLDGNGIGSAARNGRAEGELRGAG